VESSVAKAQRIQAQRKGFVNTAGDAGTAEGKKAKIVKKVTMNRGDEKSLKVPT
jgi:hypothetical protein